MFDPESRMEPGVQRDGAYFLDRDPAYFSIVLNYLRSGVLLGARMRGEGGNFTRTYRSGSGIWCLFDPWIRDPGWLKKSRSGSVMNTPDQISESLKNNFLG
jgi:hypothetical protein